MLEHMTLCDHEALAGHPAQARWRDQTTTASEAVTSAWDEVVSALMTGRPARAATDQSVRSLLV